MRWTVKSGKQRFDHRGRRTRARTDEERTANLPDVRIRLTSEYDGRSRVQLVHELLPPTSSAVYGRCKFPRRTCQRDAAAARRGAGRFSGAVLCRTLGLGGRRYCGVVMIKSNRCSGAWVWIRWTSRARPPDCFLIHRATGALRREEAITKSGHGGSSGVDRHRSTVKIDGPRKRFGQWFSELYRNCLVSYGQSRASARLINWALPPAFSPSKTQTFGMVDRALAGVVATERPFTLVAEVTALTHSPLAARRKSDGTRSSGEYRLITTMKILRTRPLGTSVHARHATSGPF